MGTKRQRKMRNLDLFMAQMAWRGGDDEINCAQCEALCEARTQIVFPTAPPQDGLLVVGEAPGQDEDVLGYGFAGQAGEVLVDAFSRYGVGPYQFGRTNICRCRPPDNRKPTRAEIESCLPMLANFLLATRPRVILTIGATAAAPFLGRDGLLEIIERQAGADHRTPPAQTLHPLIREPLTTLMPRIVPMPHTSGLAWNRTAKNGERWSTIGVRQIGEAVRLLRAP